MSWLQDRVIEARAKLAAFPKDAHWFCPAYGDEDASVFKYPDEPDEDYSIPEKHKRIAESAQRLEIAFNNCFVLGTSDSDFPESTEWKAQIEAELDKQLARCYECVQAYHENCPNFITKLELEFGPTLSTEYRRILDAHDFARIERGLIAAKDLLEKTLSVDRKQRVLKDLPHALLAITEAMCCEPYYTSDEHLSRFFDDVFAMVQTNKVLKLAEILPASTYFLFSENPVRRNFALSCWELAPKISSKTYEWAVRKGLVANIQSVCQGRFPGIRGLRRFWAGLFPILDKLDKDEDFTSEVFTNVDGGTNIPNLLLEHLPFESDELFLLLIKSFRVIAQSKASEAIYSSVPHASYSTYLDQIIKSPSFRNSASHSENLEVDGITFWALPFIQSLKPNHKYHACDLLLHQLFELIQHDPDADIDSKATCLHSGLVVLRETISSSISVELKPLTARILADNVLGLVERYKKPIFSCTALSDPDKRELAGLAMFVVQEALKLDCKMVKLKFEMISANEDLGIDITSHSVQIWQAALDAFSSDHMDMAKNILTGLHTLIGIQPFREKVKKVPLTPQMTAFNELIEKISGIVARIFEKLSDFTKKQLRPLFHTRVTAFSMYGALISANDEVSQAMRMVLERYTDESTTKEALSILLHEKFFETITCLHMAIQRIGTIKQDQPFEPMPRLLRISREVLDGLCDTNGGVLREITLTSRDLTVVKAFWVNQWALMNKVFDLLESWSMRPNANKAQMHEFARDAMDHADALFDQFALLKSSLAMLTNSKQDLLKAMEQNLEYMTKWLRLKDNYLANTLVNLISKLLKRLADEDVVLASDCNSLNYIRDTIGVKENKSIKTNLTEQQKAELMRAIENNQGVEFVDSVHKPRTHKQSKLDGWSNAAGDDQPSTARPQTTVSNLTRGSKTHKEHLDKIRAKHEAKTAKAVPSRPAQDLTFAQKRKKDKEDFEAKKKLEIAKHLNNAKVQGEGSALQGMGILGKDHTPKGQSIMCDESSSESNDEEDEQVAKDRLTRKGVSSAFSGTEGARKKQQAQGPVRKVKMIRSVKDMRARLSPNMDRLHLTLLSWNIFHEGETPPGDQVCTPIAEKFLAAHEYRDTMYPLLVSEAWKNLMTVREESKLSKSKPFDIKIVNRMNVDNYIEISTTIFYHEMKDQEISDGSIVLLSHGKDPIRDDSAPNCLARVFKTARNQQNKEKMDVSYRVSNRATNNVLSILSPGIEIRGLLLTTMTTIEREFAALFSLEYYDLCDEILKSKTSPLLKYRDEVIAPIEHNYKVNKAQAKAILSAKENDAFTLIQGPPGSGKTKTIVAMVGALLTHTLGTRGISIAQPGSKSSASNAAQKKLLICAPSNAAVDEIVSRLKTGVKTLRGDFCKINVIRIGRLGTIGPGVQDVSLEKLINTQLQGSEEDNQAMMKDRAKRDELFKQDDILRAKMNQLRQDSTAATDANDNTTKAEVGRQLDKLRRERATLQTEIDKVKDSGNISGRNKDIKRREIQQQIIDASDVVCATLSGSGHDMFKNISVEFETVIIDEAAQCIELSALIPLKYGCSKCILVGDPKQLPPTVLSKMAANYGYEQSLFVRMQKNHPDDVHLLDTQYRMHPDISRFPSQKFYDGQLIDGPDMAALRKQPWHRHPLLGPYRFFDVKGSQQRGHGHSLMNLAEIKVAMQLYRRVTSDFRNIDWNGKVGVITPYKSQLTQLRLEFKNAYGDGIFDKIEFNTTDAFQGREAEVIIFSCVRAQASGGVGFLNDIRRMNVGLTRAKSSLWVLGDSQSLMQGPYWRKLITDAQERGRYTDGNFMSLLNTPLANGPDSMGSFNENGVEVLDDDTRPSLQAATSAMRSSSIPDAEIADAPLHTDTGDNYYPKSSSAEASPGLKIAPGQEGNLLHQPPSRIFGNTCLKCGSYAHITSNCDQEVSLGQTRFQRGCRRCGKDDHYSPACSTERCLTCGQFGHVSKVCVNKPLSNHDKDRLARDEDRWESGKAERAQKRKAMLSGNHNPQVPVIQTTLPPPLPPPRTASGSSPPTKSNNKRQRGGSPSDDMANKKIPTGPRADRMSSYGMSDTRINGMAPPGNMNGRHLSFGGHIPNRSAPGNPNRQGSSWSENKSPPEFPAGSMNHEGRLPLPGGFTQTRDDGNFPPASDASRGSGSHRGGTGPHGPGRPVVPPRRPKIPAGLFIPKPKPRR